MTTTPASTSDLTPWRPSWDAVDQTLEILGCSIQDFDNAIASKWKRAKSGEKKMQELCEQLFAVIDNTGVIVFFEALKELTHLRTHTHKEK